MSKTDARADWERSVIERAAYFTTFRFNGRNNPRDRREFHPADLSDDARAKALEAARADAAGDRRALVYAVAADGMSAHVEEGFAL